ncbi:MAG TPA: tRNA (adenosine(37)-N6)-threonylcarbamoyltransferase complex ATPase subunit type 1 TsaE [Sphingobacteriaceae bacterium]
MVTQVESEAQLEKAAEELLRFAGDRRVFLFEGEMGAGKTTFIKSICNVLGVEQLVSSPTFSIVNEYPSPGGLVYHFDFYRLKDETEAYDLGYEDYFYSGNYCFVEWPSRVRNLWPDNSVMVDIRFRNGENREIQASLNP